MNRVKISPAHHSSSAIINNFNSIGISFLPVEADAPWFMDALAIQPTPIPCPCLNPVEGYSLTEAYNPWYSHAYFPESSENQGTF
jgi:hypothetical protein